MKHTIIAAAIAACVFVGSSSRAHAQAGIGMVAGLGAAGAYGGGWGWGNFGGGTVEGNALMGMSQVIRSEGEYNEATTRAYINYEDARSKYIDNKKKWTDAYFSMREENSAAMAQKRERDRHSPEVLAIANRAPVVKPLSSDALDPTTGRLQWPDVLKAPEYAGPRTKIEQLFEIRASGGGSNSQAIAGATQELTDILKSNIQKLPTGDYIAARRFLDSLMQSARS